MTTSEPDPEPLHEYALPTLTVEWRPARCTHSAVCVRSLPRVFDPRRRLWVDVTAADAEAIAETVLRCPSGALALRRH
jgi:uncharacterized Fe-S cluster protein YjdI